MRTDSKDRRRLFTQLQHVLDQNAAIDRALASFGEGLAEEDALVPVLDVLADEAQRNDRRRRQQPAA